MPQILLRKLPSFRPSQGDLLTEVDFLESAIEVDGKLEVKKIRFPFALVLTQDCDLSQDSKFRVNQAKTDDKRLFSVLLAPLYNFEHFFRGEHLSEIEMTMADVSKQGNTVKRHIQQNMMPRYHYLEFDDKSNLPPLVLDFKHYFCISVAALDDRRTNGYQGSLPELYREDVSQRFAAFLSRIGIPDATGFYPQTRLQP